MEELEHFSHDHPLFLMKGERDEIVRKSICYGCQRPILVEPAYSCGKCRFFLHKKCAELPKDISHPMHPQHRLILLQQPPLDFFKLRVPRHRLGLCGSCGRSWWGNFTYRCDTCEFDLDIICATIEDRKLEHPGHVHALTFKTQCVNFQCHACGETKADTSYSCTSCPYWIHDSCASLPAIKKHEHHDHPLSLAYCLSDDHIGYGYSCDVCHQNIIANLWNYYCSPCRHFVHIHCVERWNYKSLMKKLKHFSHEHLLILMKGERDETVRKSICYGCQRPILAEPTYSCGKCRFFLHKKCFELPEDISHPMHPQHRLVLRQKTPEDAFPFRRLGDCSCCGKRCWGNFYYHCNTCEFNLDIVCATTEVRQLKNHPSHVHALTFKMQWARFWCHACGETEEDTSSYSCTSCPYWIHGRCASLPTEKKRWDHDHPLSLAYCLSDDRIGYGFSCDVCHEDILEHLWNYYCGPCRHFVHIHCIEKHKDQAQITHSLKGLVPWLRPELGLPTDDFVGSLENLWIYSELSRLGHFGPPSPLGHLGPPSPLGHFGPQISLDPFGLPFPPDSFGVIWRPGQDLITVSNPETEMDGGSGVGFALQRDTHGILGGFRHPSPPDPFGLSIERGFFGLQHPRDSFDVIWRPGQDLIRVSNPKTEMDGDSVVRFALQRDTQKVRSSDEEITCEACCRRIISRCYKRADSNYFLHVTCALKRQTSLWGVDLKQRLPASTWGFFKCDVCHLDCNGYSFYGYRPISGDGFCLDVNCAMLPDEIAHAAHTHLLKRRSVPRDRPCNGCGYFDCSSYFNFICSGCKFSVGYHCALLPETVKHRWDKHRLILSFPPYTDQLGKFYCEVCEEEIHPRRWQYRCRKCDRSFHPRCIPQASASRNIKFGITVDVGDHPHTLKLVPEGEYRPGCGSCGESLYCRRAFKCAENCKFYLCHDCVVKIKSKGSANRQYSRFML